MKPDTPDTKKLLLEFLEENRLTCEDLSRIFRIPENSIKDYLETGTPDPLFQFPDEFHKLFALTFLQKIPDDDRLRSFCDLLYTRWKLCPETLSRITGLPLQTVNALSTAPAGLSYEDKYRLAVRMAYMLFLLSER